MNLKWSNWIRRDWAVPLFTAGFAAVMWGTSNLAFLTQDWSRPSSVMLVVTVPGVVIATSVILAWCLQPETLKDAHASHWLAGGLAITAMAAIICGPNGGMDTSERGAYRGEAATLTAWNPSTEQAKQLSAWTMNYRAWREHAGDARKMLDGALVGSEASDRATQLAALPGMDDAYRDRLADVVDSGLMTRDDQLYLRWALVHALRNEAAPGTRKSIALALGGFPDAPVGAP